MNATRTLSSLEELKDFVTEIVLPKITQGQTIGLCGELGAGKTTFTKVLLAELGSTDEVSSPSYILEHIYSLPQDRTVSHWDLYRISQQPDEFDEAESHWLTIIEWVDKVPELVPRCQFILHFELIDQEKRTVILIDTTSPQR